MQQVIRKLRNSHIARIHAIALGTAILVWSIYGEWTGLYGLHFIGYDYTFFYYAFQTVIHHGTVAELYDIHAQHAFLKSYGYPVIRYDQYVYPPQFAVLFSFLGWLPFRVSMWTWISANVLAYGLGVFFTTRVIFSKVTPEGGLLIGFVVLIMTPFHIDAGVGNVNSLIFCMISLSFYLMYRANRPLWAGVPIAVAIICKVTPIAILVLFVLRRRWKPNLSAIGTLVLVSLISVSVFGFDTITVYLHRFLSFGHTSMKNGPAPYNQSLIGVLEMFVSHHALTLSTRLQYDCFFAVSLIIGLLVLVISRKKDLSPAVEFSLASFIPLIFSPLVEQMHLMLAIPAILSVIQAAMTFFKNKNVKPGVLLFGVGVVAIVLLSLPATFALNEVVRRFPSLYFVHTQMWLAMAILVPAVLWLGMRRGDETTRFGLRFLPGESVRN